MPTDSSGQKTIECTPSWPGLVCPGLLHTFRAQYVPQYVCPWWVNQSASKLPRLSMHQSVPQSLCPCVRALRNELNKSEAAAVAVAAAATAAAAPSCWHNFLPLASACHLPSLATCGRVLASYIILKWERESLTPRWTLECCHIHSSTSTPSLPCPPCALSLVTLIEFCSLPQVACAAVLHAACCFKRI